MDNFLDSCLHDFSLSDWTKLHANLRKRYDYPTIILEAQETQHTLKATKNSLFTQIYLYLPAPCDKLYAMTRTYKRRKVIVALEMACASGRNQLMGVFRFLGYRRNWDIRLLQTPRELTPDVVESAAVEGVDGLITCVDGTPGTIDALVTAPFPVVTLDQDSPTLKKRRRDIAFVSTDDNGVGVRGARFLSTLGKIGSFAFVPSVNGEGWSKRREKAFREELSRTGASCHVFPGGNVRELGLWLETLPRPAAVMAATDIRARQVIEACHDRGIDIPVQAVVLGVDNDELLCEHPSPTLSSVLPDFEGEGFKAAQALQRLMNARRPCAPMVIKCSVKDVVVRESTHPFSPSENLVRRAKNFIAREAAKGASVADVVANLGVSRRLADLRFKQITGETIGNALTRARLDAVTALLRQHRVPLSLIPARCGFANANALRNLFRRTFGVSMRAWRDSITKNPCNPTASVK